ncbi:hypothetical protein A2Y99_03405 [Candidatus Gottesmanbacteria bacterium RBG_13_37_7]|uniref:Phosphodiester glycosidase domain-containing protein n=1 Tax=Candidatus Gottesmanbacteria bacterium RBG_13_37_7 TaxID=1798369 RepID=A0A1F5YJ83_9BACT|nr:MAG: hypothetical protein A2Y99_03405 [Candidatus Gottesmanbacteria bacterium RBG_13_37_7]
MKVQYLSAGIVITILIILIFTVSIFTSRSNRNNSADILSSSVIPPNTVEMQFRDRNYWISFINIPDIKRLYLYPNFEKQVSSESLMRESKCQNLISGGFYTKDNQPLGLLTSEGYTIREKTNNILINGIFYVLLNNQFGIVTSAYPLQNARLALQSGPIIIERSKQRKISIRNDKTARRVVLGMTESKELFFFIIHDKENILLGPYLSQLPEFMHVLGNKMGIKIDYAMNLDGGRASAFHSDYYHVTEVTYIGSYFCLI